MPKSKILIFFEYTLLLFFRFLVFVLPQNWISCLARGLGFLIYSLSFSLRKISFDNLNLAFSSIKTKQQIKEIQKLSFFHLAHFMLDFIQLKNASWNNYKKRIFFSKGSLETLYSLIEQKKGILCISAHYGHWEILAFALAQFHPLNIIYRSLDNPLLNQFVNRIRSHYPSGLIERKNAFFESMQILKKGQILAILMDQHQAKNPVFISFFGKKAATTKGPAAMAYKSGALVMGSFIFRHPNSTYTIILRQIPILQKPSYQSFVQANTQVFSHFIENFIHQAPEQWFWFHPRWKNKKAFSKS